MCALHLLHDFDTFASNILLWRELTYEDDGIRMYNVKTKSYGKSN